MEKRLMLAKKLLNPRDSVLIVTIDEKEYAHLGCLLERLFSEANIQMISTLIAQKGVSRKNSFYRTNEYIYIIQIGNSSVCPLELNEEWKLGKKESAASKGIVWSQLRRSGTGDLRTDSPHLFYPILFDKTGGKITGTGESLFPLTKHPSSAIETFDDCILLWPIKKSGVEGRWQLSQDEFKSRLEKGYIKCGKLKLDTIPISYLKRGSIQKIENGDVIISAYKGENKTVEVDSSNYQHVFVPGSQWNIGLHDATYQGSQFINALFGENRFDFPKSLYAVHDAIRFFVNNKPSALILDFFAGSGTTLHAVNLLNAEDGGHRRCIMVTNNEIGETKERELKPQGIRPGDEEWEKWGIARYVTWPRTECSIKGIDVNGNPIDGEYITTKTETKRSDRRFNQISFLTNEPTLKQKKAIVALINKQKTIKLPSMSQDADFLLAEEDDSCNASILFDVTAIDDWKEALEGHDEITDFYIVTQKDALFRKIKTEVSELMGQIEESVPVSMPMKDGFKANAAYFKLGFLDKTSVALGRQFKELLPILWMKAGARGECPTIESEELPKMLICENNHFAVLLDEYAYPMFEKKVNEAKGIDTAYIVTDSDSGYKEMAQGLNVDTCYQLYRDYLDNFRINNIR